MILAKTSGDDQVATVNTASHKLQQQEAATIINTGHIFKARGAFNNKLHTFSQI